MHSNEETVRQPTVSLLVSKTNKNHFNNISENATVRYTYTPYVLTDKSGIQTVNGYITIYQNAQNPATKNDIKMNISNQIIENTGLAI